MSKVILISGYRDSGKDTVATLLINEYGCVRIGFADLLKNISSRDYPLDRDLLDDREYKEAPMLAHPVFAIDRLAEIIQDEVFTHFRTAGGIEPNVEEKEKMLTRVDGYLYWGKELLYFTPRAVLVIEGGCKRSFNSNYWVDTPVMDNLGKNIAVSDCRYPNEASRTKEILEGTGYEVYVIRVDSPEGSKANDASERGMDHYTNFYARILNEKDKSSEEAKRISIEKFYSKCRPIMDSIFN